MTWDQMRGTFDRARYINLETFRRNGQGVRTPVWFVVSVAPGGGTVFYVPTGGRSGKVKRLRRDAAVRVAPCDMRGRTTGPWVAARGRVADEDEFATGTGLLNRKYRPWKQLLDWFMRLRSTDVRTVLAIEDMALAADGPRADPQLP